MEPIFDKLHTLFHSENWAEEALQNEWDIEELSSFSACNYKFAYSDKDQMVSIVWNSRKEQERQDFVLL